MNKLILSIFTTVLLIMSGCNTGNTNSNENSQHPKMIEVDLIVEPEHPTPGKEVTIRAVVTQGDELVDDADEVMFEVWKKGQENHETIEGYHQGDGVYSISKTFKESGVYYTVSHVTARGMHHMPKKEFIVGEVENHNKNEKKQPQNHGQHDETNDSHMNH